MARLLNLIILSALIVAAAASDAGKGKWYRTAKCLRHSWQKQLDPLLEEYFQPKTVAIVKIYAAFEFRFPGDNEFTVWLKIKIDGVVQYAIVEGYKYDSGELRIYTVYLYPYDFGSVGVWERTPKSKFENLEFEFEPYLREYYTPKRTNILKIYVVWERTKLDANENGETVMWTKIKVDAVLYLAEIKGSRAKDGQINFISVNRYPYKSNRCPKKSC